MNRDLRSFSTLSKYKTAPNCVTTMSSFNQVQDERIQFRMSGKGWTIRGVNNQRGHALEPEPPQPSSHGNSESNPFPFP